MTVKSLTFGAPSGPAREYTLGGDGYLAALGYDPSRIPNPESRISNRINEPGFVYDANGNLIADPKFCYDYDELNRMIAARPKDSAGVCAAQPAADYFYDADNLRTVKRLWSASGTQPLSFTTTVRGGLDAVSDITTHVSDGKEATQPYEQKNYVYGPGGLVASEKRVLYANSNPAWQLYGASTGCTVNNPAASAEALASNGYDLILNFGACASSSIKTMTLEWHELNADGTPKDCTNQRTDATTNFNARYNCGLLHLNPALGTSRLYKLKYASTSYDVKVIESVEMGLYGSKTFVVSRFTASLAKGQPTTALVYNDQTPPPPAPGASLGAPGPGGREVNYYQKDHLGTIRVVSDENGTVLSTHDYEPFGLELPSQDFSFNTHRFTGHERDTETGLDYMKARYFGASMGRFGAVDSAWGSIDAGESNSWNRFSYTNNNPVRYFDSDGNDDTDSTKPQSARSRAWGAVKSWFNLADTAQRKTEEGLTVDQLQSKSDPELDDAKEVSYDRQIDTWNRIVPDVSGKVVYGAVTVGQTVVEAGAGAIVSTGVEALGSGFKAFTPRCFRANLSILTGAAPDAKLVQAHHVLPQKFESQFAKAGMNIHHPRFDAWWSAAEHSKNSKKYEKAWAKFFREVKNPTKEQIPDKARELAKEFGYNVNF